MIHYNKNHGLWSLWSQSIVLSTLQILPLEQQRRFIFFQEEKQKRRKLQRNHWFYWAALIHTFFSHFLLMELVWEIIELQIKQMGSSFSSITNMLGHCGKISWPLWAPVSLFVKRSYNINWILSSSLAFVVLWCYF